MKGGEGCHFVVLTSRRLRVEDYGQPISFHTLHLSNPTGIVVGNRKTLFMGMTKKWACFSVSLSFPASLFKRALFSCPLLQDNRSN
jgi:hypothetical protein